jgi:hypothetical protein
MLTITPLLMRWPAERKLLAHTALATLRQSAVVGFCWASGVPSGCSWVLQE